MAVAFDAAASAAATQVSPITWTHNNSAADNAFLVATNYTQGTTPAATAVSYGGVALSRLGTVPANNAGPGGCELWGVLGSVSALPTGNNTVSVTTVPAGNDIVTGSISLSGSPASFGTVFTHFNTGTADSVSVTGTTSGGMIVAAATQGSTFPTVSSPGTSRIAIGGDSSTGADNIAAGTWPSPGGTQVCAFTSGVTSDLWATVAVEVLPPAGSSAPPVFRYPRYAPKWHPGRGLPGLPGGIPFYDPPVIGLVQIDTIGGDWPSFVDMSGPRPRGASAHALSRAIRSRARIFQVPVTSATGNTFTADTSLAVTSTITADSAALAGSSRMMMDQPGSRPRWTALLRNKTRRGRYFTVPTTGLQTADTSLTVTAGITAAVTRVVSADTSLTVTAAITSAATAGGGSTQQIISRPAPRPRWAALLRAKQLRKRHWTVPATGLQTIDTSITVTAGITASATRIVSADTSVTVTAGITADSFAGGESTRAIIRQPGSRPKWAALLRTKTRRERFYGIAWASTTSGAIATETVTATVTAAVTETASANTSLTVAAGISAAAAFSLNADTSRTVTAGITAAASETAIAAASVTVTAGVTAAATATDRAAASLTVTAGITAAANVGISASEAVTAGITASASETGLVSAQETVTAGITASAQRAASADTAVPVTAGITADTSDTRPASASLTVSAGIFSAASVTAAASASLTVSAAVTSAISFSNTITATIEIKWNVDVLNAPSSTLLANHWKSMTNDSRLMARDGVKYMTNDTRDSVKDGIKFMTNGGY